MDKKYLERTLLSTQPTIALRDCETDECVVRFLTLSRASKMQEQHGYALVRLDGVLKLYGVLLPRTDYRTLALVPYVIKRIEEETQRKVELLACGQQLHVLDGVLYIGETEVGECSDLGVVTLHEDGATDLNHLLSAVHRLKPRRTMDCITLHVKDVFQSHSFVGGHKATLVRNALALDEFLKLPYQRVRIVFEAPVAFTTSFFITLLDGLVRKEETVSQFLQRVEFVGCSAWLEHIHQALDELKLRQVTEET